jgi:quercetin dioxygenase-like cupin family protein
MQRHASTVLVTGEATSGRCALVETVERRGDELPCHRHHWEDTTLYVLEGELAVFLAGQWIHGPAGAAVFVPRGVEHTIAVMSPAARVLRMLVPAGCEQFYQELATERAVRAAEGAAPAAIERLVTLAARYGCEITGSHPGRPTNSSNGSQGTAHNPSRLPDDPLNSGLYL